ncbi:hypothetical protein SCP_0411440 [Sparassis crispa]|uniref:MYND-type domain-containing protein n=1 Tax=Sparassis crispa TaxID=139825 RepID=A0A401GKT6_9APHY|nr:hypothetical protein SCP_0411440 [Sparassis crispa]GBE82759.1 hypothetical protein SCP_0411440 [Sparassis crispa]
MSQKVFFKATKPLRSKLCEGCRKEPSAGEHFKVCSGCKGSAYCSRVCQQRNWKTHKPLCELTQRELLKIQFKDRFGLWSEPHIDSTQEERVNLLHDFTEVYAWSIEKAIFSALHLGGGEESFDYSKGCIVFDLRYRPDCNGNPSLAFELLDARIEPIARHLEGGSITDAFYAGQPLRVAKERELRAAHDDFLGVLMTLWTMEAYGNWHPHY